MYVCQGLDLYILDKRCNHTLYYTSPQTSHYYTKSAIIYVMYINRKCKISKGKIKKVKKFLRKCQIFFAPLSEKLDTALTDLDNECISSKLLKYRMNFIISTLFKNSTINGTTRLLLKKIWRFFWDTRSEKFVTLSIYKNSLRHN